MSFYQKVRPWGFWGPITEKCKQQDSNFETNKEFSIDMLNVVVGIAAQTILVMLPMYLIFQQFVPVYALSGALIICIVLLKKYWWNRLAKS